MQTNIPTKNKSPRTYEGGKAVEWLTTEQQLLQSVAGCLLFENSFYESGDELATRIVDLSQKVSPEFLGKLAVYARSKLNLRHVSLWLAVQLLRHKNAQRKAQVICDVIQRADELSEIISLYWKQNPETKPISGKSNIKRAPLAYQLRKGVAMAFRKFNEYGLQKYNRSTTVKLRDAMFLSHPKPKDDAQNDLWQRLITDTLTTPETWETELSAGKDKKITFERLLSEHKLGYLATLRNLRQMDEAKVDRRLVTDYLIKNSDRSRALPFQFVAAWRYAPTFASAIDTAMIRALGSQMRLAGSSTVLLIDVSGSMDYRLSHNSELSRIDAASALAILCREVCDDCRIFTFSNGTVEVPARRGLGLVDAILQSQSHRATHLRMASKVVAERVGDVDRVLILTDEQSQDGAPTKFGKHSYLINVASYAPKLDTSEGWTRINGFSERIVEFIRFLEASTQKGWAPWDVKEIV